jgi:hypothetical protein
MSNADEPASPQFGVIDASGNMVTISEWTGEIGLTKRESFAMNAPKMPDWFRDSKQCKCVSIEEVLTDQEQKDFVEYSRENYGYDRFDEGIKANQKYAEILQEYYLEHNKKVYFEWCCYYADGLLEKLQEKL